MADQIDITDPVVDPLGRNVITVTGSSGFGPDSMRWDCSIAGMPFLFAFSDQYPFQRETATFRRERIDTERNPGEQSLDSGYWLRSQASWHYGSGLTSAEPLEIDVREAQFRYAVGGGIDPWTPGRLSLLHSSSAVASASATGQLLLGVSSGVLHAAGTALSYIPAAAAASAITWGGSASAISSITTDGANYYAANASAIYKGALPTGNGSLLYNTGDVTLVRWVKSRLMATVGKGIYELTAAGPSLPTALDAGGSRPDGWTWTDIAEGPNAIYLSGYVGDASTIERITVSTSASAVTLDVPTVVAEMPRGEKVLTLYSYAGSFLVVGTSAGCRIAALNSDGSLTMGPLVVDAGAVDDVVAVGSYVYVTVRDKGSAGDRATRAGLYRIDLGRTLAEGRLSFASAADLVAPSGVSGSAVQVTTAAGLLWFAVDGTGVMRETSEYVTDGWLETGRIRMGTLESKAWREVRVLADKASNGTIAAYATLDDTTAPSSWSSIISVSGSTRDASGQLNAVTSVPQPNLFLAFKLTRGSASATPVLIGYQLKAMPAPKRSELIKVPLLCFDFELDRTGARYGKIGNSRARYEALKALEASAATVTWRDLTTGETAEGFIERVEFMRTTPPTRQVSGNGGIASVLLRLL